MKAQTYTLNDVGCYADGSRGIYLTDRVVEIANDHGASITHDWDCGCDFANGRDSFAQCDFSNEIGDEATDYMNEHYSVEGCYWGFVDGDWGLWTDSDN